MNRPQKDSLRIGISLGNTANFQDGLGEFSFQLGNRLAAQARRLRDEHNITLHFHMLKEWHGMFGDDVSYLPVARLQRWSHRLDEPFALWHKLHQLNKTRAPEGTPHRIVTVHDLNFAYFKTGYSRWRDLRRSKRLLDQATHIVTISDYVRQDVLKRIGWRKPIEVVYNGARSFVSSAKEEIPQSDGKPYLFHLSRMAKSKNISAILDLARHWPEMNFVLAGPENRDTREVALALKTLALSNVTLLLSISDAQKAWLYENCAGFLFPSLTEGFGLPPIEAMHFGKPVFLSDRTCLPEIGGAHAAYFTDFSATAMRDVVAAGLVSLASRSAEIKAHASVFDWDECASKYLGIYLRLLRAEH
jgi:glycosyltransferase involved in cell wall biosynthesis